MKKKKILISIICLIILLAVLIFYHLYAQKEITIYREYSSGYKPLFQDKDMFGFYWHIISSEEARKAIMKKDNLKIPEVDFSKYYILWSPFRKIKKMTYQNITEYKWWEDAPKGIATFGDKNYPNTVFFYKINKVYLMSDWGRLDELEKKWKEKHKLGN